MADPRIKGQGGAIRPAVKAALKVNELVEQFENVDVPDGVLETGSADEINQKFDDAYLVGEARNRLDLINDQLEAIDQDTYPADFKLYSRDKRQLVNFIKRFEGSTLEQAAPQAPQVTGLETLFREPRSPDKSKLPAVIDAASVAAEAARLGADWNQRMTGASSKSRPKGKGAAFRGLGSLARAPIFKVARLVQEGYNLLPEDYKVIEDWVARMKETQTHELFGMDKPGIEYLKEWLGLSDSEPEGDTIPAKDAPSALGFNIDAYHGTTYLDYDEPSAISRFYEKKDVGTGLGGLNDLGHWFSESPVVASSFASGEEGNILPVKLRLKNPASYETYEDLETALSVLGKDDPLFFQEYLKSLGHDGVVIEDSFTDVPESRRDYVVFSPKNVRSRFAKFGLKESQSPYLSKAAGGFVDKPLYDDARIGGMI